MRRLATSVIATLGAVLVNSCATAGGGHAGASLDARGPSRDAGPSLLGVPFVEGAAPYTPPRSKEPLCVQKNVRIPRAMEAYVTGPLTVKFAVLSDGRIDGFSMLTIGVPDEVALLVKDAVESCTWMPGTDQTGRPALIWVLLPLRFDRVAD
jgi:hypothetical protein